MLGKIINPIFLNSSKFKGTETPLIFASAFINSFLSCRSFVRICLAFFSGGGFGEWLVKANVFSYLFHFKKPGSFKTVS